MTVTQAPAMPFWDSDSVLCQYSDDLRRTFFQINPYHVSCLYKPTFEEHALNKLRDCEADMETTAAGLFAEDQDDTDSQVEDNEDDSGISAGEELQMLGLDDEEGNTGVRSQDSNHNQATLPLSFRFYESMRLPSPSEECGGDLKSWKTCTFLHSQEVDKNTFCSKPTVRKGSANRSSAQQALNLQNAHGGNNSRQSSATLGQRPTKTTVNVQDLVHCMEFDVEFPKPSMKYRLPKKKRHPSAHSHAQGTILAPPPPLGPIEYPFHHSRPHSYYVDVYRECYTDKQHVLCNTSSIKAAMSSRKYQALPKAHIHCSDVRHGAYLKTTPLPRPSDIKASQICFKMAARLGNGSPTWTREPSSSRSQTPSPCNLGGPQLSDHQNINHDKADGNRPMISIQRAQTPVNQQVHVPIVSRSRPTIPSNANGVICPTAVETPGHVVSVKGHSLWDRQRTALVHLFSVNSALYDQGRPHTVGSPR